jgi:hypothetical protein
MFKRGSHEKKLRPKALLAHAGYSNLGKTSSSCSLARRNE